MPGAYIHIPFCRRKCTYCGFYSLTRLELLHSYLTALKHEMEIRRQEFEAGLLSSVYIGGGTPSLLQPLEIQQILENVKTFYKILPSAEITLEVNPDNLNQEYFKSLKDTEINRLSIGIQSFFDEDLRIINRSHNGRQAEQALELAEKYNYRNISVDLIFGLPESNIRKWAENLEKVKNVPHLSCYQLTVEDNSILALQLKKNKIVLPQEEEIEAQYSYLLSFAADNAFERYEISNFCKHGMYSKHNSSYWKYETYIGFGPGAHSFFPPYRSWNKCDLNVYCSSLRGCNVQWKSLENIVYEKEFLDKDMQFNEFVMTSLRTVFGCSLTEIEKCFGKKYLNHLFESLKHIPEDYYFIDKNTLILSDKGLAFADAVAVDLAL